MYTKQDSAIILIGVVGSRTTTDSTHAVGYQICTARGLNVSVNLTVKRNPTETFSDTYKLRIQIVTYYTALRMLLACYSLVVQPATWPDPRLD